MNRLAFLFEPPWMGLLSLLHVAALALAVAGALTGGRRRAGLAVVLLLAALAWPAVAVISAAIVALPPSAAPPRILPWLQLGANLPLWAAVLLGLVLCARATPRRRD